MSLEDIAANSSFEAEVEDKSGRYESSRKWEWGYLRKECENLGIEGFYKTYIRRMQRSCLAIFFFLQTLINISHIILITVTESGDEPTSPDILLYSISTILVWICMFPAFKEDMVKKYPQLPFVCSCFALFTLVLSDLSIPIYHAVNTHTRPPLRPAYASHILLVIYIFLPIMENYLVVLLAASTTICYLIVMYFVTYNFGEKHMRKIISELIFLVSINFFGNYFRLMSEIDIRRTFLDRRECVQRNLLLRFERNQEQELLLSILPEHIAEKMEKDIQNMIKKTRNNPNALNPRHLEVAFHNKRSVRQWSAINKLYVETHKDVSILYADVVNYTQITTQLPVRTLVEVLHEIFVKFDEASMEFNVLRIKFLGDCYYGISGAPVKNKRHAQNCVDLGLKMISEIREVRQARNLSIDMRIGVHSGRVIGGVIGACKWQYDIWSKDVVIANKIESTGVAGKVHVTAQTLDLLDGNYNFEDGTESALKDPFLQKHKIQTFLISPKVPFRKSTHQQNGIMNGVEKRQTLPPTTYIESSTHKHFMQNSMEQFREIMVLTTIEMERELERMPIGRLPFMEMFLDRSRPPLRRSFNQEDELDLEENRLYHAKKLNNISTAFFCFENKKWELMFQKERDQMLKFSVLMSLLVYITIVGIQILNKSTGMIFYTFITISAFAILSLVPFTWFKKLYDLITPPSELDPNKIDPPNNRIFHYLYNFSFDITKNVILRTSIYLTVISVLVVCSLIHLMECATDYDAGKLTSNSSISSESEFSACLNSWSVTQSLVLAICMNFLFLRIYFLLKALVAIIIIVVYYFMVFIKIPLIYNLSASINPALDPKMAHMLKVVVTSIIFHLIDRNFEYIQRVDYNWKRQLLQKKENTEATKDTNKILVHNILPVHVADLYLTRQLNNDFYNEEYDNVACMFATITNFDMATDSSSMENEQTVLKVLNEIICKFDEKLLSFHGYHKLEKIKVAGWSYMVACGLDPGRGDSTISNKGLDGRRSFNTSAFKNLTSRRMTVEAQKQHKTSLRQMNNVVIVLAEFALELMRDLRDFRSDSCTFERPLQLRIGISHGKVMAGVVGFKKPLYDIFGNAVNMASRMDSTGLPGSIQLTEDTANVLTSFGFKCEFRGETHVKGRGLIPTYFICISEDLQFIKESDVLRQKEYFHAEM